MSYFIGELNDDQLDGLAKLTFDLARASFILAILPTSFIPENPVVGLFKTLLGLFWVLVCTYLALVILRKKKGDKNES